MTSVALQQVTSKFALRNAGKTLERPIALKYLQKHLSPEQFQEIEFICTEGRVYVWGSKFERVHQYGKMPPCQTLALFRRGSKVYKCGVIIKWLFNEDLAEYLWGLDNDNQTWSLVFLLKELKELSVSAWEINKLLERKPADNWQGLLISQKYRRHLDV